MNLTESLLSAWGTILTNRLRTLLTMLGVMIGVASVIALVSIGQGANAQVKSQVSGLGANLITVLPMRGTNLTMEDVDALRQRVPTVARAVPSLSASVTVKGGVKTYDTTVEGVNEALLEVRNHHLAEGRFLTAGDVATRRRVAVVGQEVLRQLGLASPLGTDLTIAGQPFFVVGVLAAKGSTFGRNEDDVVFIPVTTAQRIAGTTYPSTIYLSARSSEDAGLAAAHALAVLGRRHPRSDGQDPVRIMSQDQLLSAMNSVSRTMTLFLGAIAGVSLLVGGIGIMNIMLVSVTERTREIGIRMAVGARPRDILGQFLIESVLLSLTGGITGAVIGVGAAGLVGRLMGSPAILSPESVLAALTFALAVGLFFGGYPAWRASRLDPIVALRHE